MKANDSDDDWYAVYVGPEPVIEYDIKYPAPQVDSFIKTYYEGLEYRLKRGYVPVGDLCVKQDPDTLEYIFSQEFARKNES